MPIVKKQLKGKLSADNGKPAKASPSREEVSIPTVKNKPSDKLFDYCISLYGEKGWGKSSLASQFPNALTFMWEPARRNLPIVQIPAAGEKPLDWPRQVAYIDLLESHPGKHCKTPIIDTIDRCYESCFQYICKVQGVKHPNEMKDYGATWNRIKREFEDQMNRLRFTGYNPIFISHAKIREISTLSGESYDMLTPTCVDAPWLYMKATCDLAFYGGYHGRERVLVVRGNDMVWSACGLDNHFLTPDGDPLSAIPMGGSVKEAYHNLLAAWDNKLEGGYTVADGFTPTETERDDTDVQIPEFKKKGK